MKCVLLLKATKAHHCLSRQHILMHTQYTPCSVLRRELTIKENIKSRVPTNLSCMFRMNASSPSFFILFFFLRLHEVDSVGEDLRIYLGTLYAQQNRVLQTFTINLLKNWRWFKEYSSMSFNRQTDVASEIEKRRKVFNSGPTQE